MTLKVVDYILLIIIFCIIEFIKSYIVKKGENLATKEDIKEITNKVEEIKKEHAKDLEKLKIELARGSQIKLQKYMDQYIAVKNTWAKLIPAKNLVLEFRPTLTISDPKESVEQRRERLIPQFAKVFNNWSETLDAERPFIPIPIYTKFTNLRKAIIGETNAFRLHHPDKWQKYWEEADANQDKINQLLEDCNEEITTWIQGDN